MVEETRLRKRAGLLGWRPNSFSYYTFIVPKKLDPWLPKSKENEGRLQKHNLGQNKGKGIHASGITINLLSSQAPHACWITKDYDTINYNNKVFFICMEFRGWLKFDV